MSQSFDLIGDIHGHADALERLLRRMGYTESGGVFGHPDRIAIFVGDFIDRGPQNRRVVEIARTMVEAGTAHAIMGNHEYNAICYHTPRPDNPNEYLREHTDKNYHQHERTLMEFAGDQAGLQEMIDWFWSLPLYLELDGLRVVHACWHEESLALLDKALAPGHYMTREFLLAANRNNSPEYEAVEAVLKGVEFELPDDISFKDKEGHARQEARIRWWLNDATTLDEMVIGPPDLGEQTKGYPAEKSEMIGYKSDAPPVFFGHYWLRGTPELQRSNVACLDYSVGKGDKLVAYRWDGESQLSDDKFLWESA